jgi:hypothetical protein
MKRNECLFDHLTKISFFRCTADGADGLSHKSDDSPWKNKIKFELGEVTSQNLQKSVNQFMEQILIMENDSRNKLSGVELINKMVEANDKDNRVDCEQINHLYALIRAKPDFVKSAIHARHEDTVSNKRQKFN